jgi:hypothetical protein
MYGPKPQKHVSPLDKAIPTWYQCSHTHVSGRRCKRRVASLKTACLECQPVKGDYCTECISMLKAFDVVGF